MYLFFNWQDFFYMVCFLMWFYFIFTIAANMLSFLKVWKKHILFFLEIVYILVLKKCQFVILNNFIQNKSFCILTYLSRTKISADLTSSELIPTLTSHIHVVKMELLCNESFWNITIFSDLDHPNFSKCFRNIILPGK